VAPVSTDRFATLLRELEQSRFTAFVAALWDARNDEDVTIEQQYIYIGGQNESQSQTVLAVVGHSWMPNRFRRFTIPETVDILITTQQTKRYIETTGAVDARIVGPAELRSIALYAIPRPTAEKLFNQYFNTSVTIDSSHADETGTRHHSNTYTKHSLLNSLTSLIRNTHAKRRRPVASVFVVIILLTVITGSGIALGVMPGVASDISSETTSGDTTVGTIINEVSAEIQVFLGVSSASAEQQSWSQPDPRDTIHSIRC